MSLVCIKANVYNGRYYKVGEELADPMPEDHPSRVYFDKDLSKVEEQKEREQEALLSIYGQRKKAQKEEFNRIMGIESKSSEKSVLKDGVVTGESTDWKASREKARRKRVFL